MTSEISKLFFDKNDYQLLEIVNDILNRGPQSQVLRSLLSNYMHPHGIKEMAADRGLRIAYAVAGLLGSLETGKANDRITALRSLRDEVFLSSSGFFKKNTARVLIQIMKELLRSSGNELRQLKLAHNFRMVLAGNPRRVRSELVKYHLLEMPEAWNQFAFDDHVHDANTKGRKSPTHLVMDAWIKGIRYLTVVYYNYVRPEVVEELIEASAILDLNVQVGIEMSARFRDKYIRFTWEPHGFRDNIALLDFMQEDFVKQLMEEGCEVSRYQQQYVFDVLEAFNSRHRHGLNAELGVSVTACGKDEFLEFVGDGQPSLFHLARFIQTRFLEQIKLKSPMTRGENASSPPPTEGEEKPPGPAAKLHPLSVETLIDRYLLPSRNPEINDPSQPQKSSDLPARLKLGPRKLLKKLQSLHSSSKFSLNLSNLSLQDTLELLYAGKGIFTHIEAYNLKNVGHGITSGILPGYGETNGRTENRQDSSRFYRLIGDLQRALNDDNVIILKRAVRAIIWDFEEQLLHLGKGGGERRPASKQASKASLACERASMEQRKQDLLSILANLEKFHHYYRKKTLRTRIGSGSTGQGEQYYGMGLIVVDTLPARAKKEVRKAENNKSRMRLPVSASLTHNTHENRAPEAGRRLGLNKLLRFRRNASRKQWSDWSLNGFQVHFDQPGNITTLGGIGTIGENGLGPQIAAAQEETLKNPWRYLNTNLKNSLKVLLGFVPAFLTFYLTKDWWLLAYLGAFIWFGITGSRNIIQSVLGGGGLRRSPLLPWNSLVSWSRIADSLLYTGFSVPLLDYLVKTLLLDRALGITTATNPVALYAVMGLANGIYISSHNTIRGLPQSATIGNFFRSIISIPVAILLNMMIGTVLASLGVANVSTILQKWAAIISKFASDCVAAVIEGLADRQTNIEARLAAYRMKISQLFSVFAKLDLQFPEEDVLEMLQSPKMMMETLNYEAREQEKLIIVNALDLMYFWMYQPRAQKALLLIHQNMSEEEWLIFYRSQFVLKRHKEISQVFIDGLIGKNFAKALAFYLDRFEEYLADMKAIGKISPASSTAGPEVRPVSQ